MANKNLRRVPMVITAQTLYNLRKIAAFGGLGDKDLGRVVDKLVREKMLEGRYERKQGCRRTVS